MFKYFFIQAMGKVFLILLLLVSFPSFTYAVTDARDVKNIGVDEKLGEYVPSDLTFYDEEGDQVRLKDFFKDKKPVVLTLNYYECPLLCTYVLNGVTNAVNDLDSLSLGEDFSMVTVSFNPAETPELAKAKSENYHKALKNGQSHRKDWHFLQETRKT
jgi:Uncharacterized protein SCO1/SenC/PrrC, involved in biogenesis of respiratory and photosynthetic systems